MNKNKIIKTAIITSLFFLLQHINSDAIIKEDIYDEILSIYTDRDKYDEYFIELIKQSNMNELQYKKLLEQIKFYKKTNVETWWLIESGRLLFDDVIFSISDIKNQYVDKVNNYGQSQIYAYSVVKKELVGNIEELEDIYEESLKNISNMKEIFFKKFNRYPTQKELSWLKDTKTTKYSLYGGRLGRELSKEEINKIDSGEGYQLLGITESEKNEYIDFLEIHNKTEVCEVTYRRAFKGFENIRKIIKDSYKIDVFSVLKNAEREKIYINSMQKYKFNERKALDATFELLKEKGLIKDDIASWPDDIIKPELPPTDIPITKPGIDDDFTQKNPIGDLNNSIQNQQNDKIYKVLTSSISNLYKRIFTSQNSGDYIYFKFNNKEIPTNIKVNEKDEVSTIQAKTILNIVAEAINGKMVEAKFKTLISGNEKIAITDKIDTIEKQIQFNKLKDFVKEIDIELYKKEHK